MDTVNIYIYTLEVQRPLKEWVFTKDHYFSRDLQSTIPRDYYFNGLWLPGYIFWYITTLVNYRGKILHLKAGYIAMNISQKKIEESLVLIDHVCWASFTRFHLVHETHPILWICKKSTRLPVSSIFILHCCLHGLWNGEAAGHGVTYCEAVQGSKGDTSFLYHLLSKFIKEWFSSSDMKTLRILNILCNTRRFHCNWNLCNKVDLHMKTVRSYPKFSSENWKFGFPTCHQLTMRPGGATV